MYHPFLLFLQIFIQFARNQFDQIDESSNGDEESSADASSRFVENSAYTTAPEQITLKDETANTSSAMKALDGDNVWNTRF